MILNLLIDVGVINLVGVMMCVGWFGYVYVVDVFIKFIWLVFFGVVFVGVLVGL